KRGTPRDQHKPAAPTRLELGAGNELRPTDLRILDQRLVVDHLAEDDEAAVAALRQRRQVGLGEPLPRGRDRPRLQAKLLGAAQDLGNAERASAVLVTDLRRIDRDLVKAQQQYERVEVRPLDRGRRRTRHHPPGPPTTPLRLYRHST